MNPCPAITISRTLGSGGTQVGFLAARRLGWHYCDRRILRLAAEATRHSVAALSHQEEHRCGFMNQLMYVLGMGSPEAPFTPHLESPIYSRDLFALEKELMLHLVEHAPSVIVGRAGFLALKNRPDTFHVRLEADPAFRVVSLVARGEARDLEAARAAVQDSDRDRSALVRDISGQDWQDPRHFNLVLDVSRLGMESCVQRVVAEAQSRFGGRERSS